MEPMRSVEREEAALTLSLKGESGTISLPNRQTDGVAGEGGGNAARKSRRKGGGFQSRRGEGGCPRACSPLGERNTMSFPDRQVGAGQGQRVGMEALLLLWCMGVLEGRLPRGRTSWRQGAGLVLGLGHRKPLVEDLAREDVADPDLLGRGKAEGEAPDKGTGHATGFR